MEREGTNGKVLVTYHRDFAVSGYPVLRDRVAPAFEELKIRGYLDLVNLEVLEARPAGEDLAAKVHSEGHLRGVMGSGYYETALLSAGSVVMGAEEIAAGRADSAFCFVGAAGHHASHDGFWGFCFLNDVAMAVTHLRESCGLSRFAVIDIDPHFGDGTRDILGPDPEVMHINFHSGYTMGRKEGPKNHDFTLPYDAHDQQFLSKVDEALRLAGGFDHELLFIVFGHDNHRDDYGAFELSDDAYGAFAGKVKEAFPRRVCYVLSGGSNPRVARRAIGDVVGVLVS